MVVNVTTAALVCLCLLARSSAGYAEYEILAAGYEAGRPKLNEFGDSEKRLASGFGLTVDKPLGRGLSLMWVGLRYGTWEREVESETGDVEVTSHVVRPRVGVVADAVQHMFSLFGEVGYQRMSQTGSGITNDATSTWSWSTSAAYLRQIGSTNYRLFGESSILGGGGHPRLDGKKVKVEDHWRMRFGLSYAVP